MKKVPKPSNETPRREFNWPPTEEELATSSLDHSQTAHERLRAYLNWPPDDEQPPVVEDTPVASQGPQSGFCPPPEEPAPSPVIVTKYEAQGRAEGFTWPPPEEPAPLPTLETFEPAPAADERPLADPAPSPAEVVAMEYVGAAESATDEIALNDSTNDTEIDEPISDQWAFEIARLQALIEGLTEKLEWRSTGVTLNEARLKH